MKSIWMIVWVVWCLAMFSACSTTEGIPNPEVKENHSGDMGGGTGTGVVGDDPTMPEKVAE